MSEKQIEAALMLLGMVGESEISVKEAVEIIQNITRVPERIREVLEIAEERGMIKREGGRLVILETGKELFRAGEYPRIIKKKADEACTRCGRKITSCYYITLPEREVGPFGSTCIRRMRFNLPP